MAQSSGLNPLFSNVDEYMNYMQNPTRILRLEWRKMRIVEANGWTSHSWLEAHLLDERCLRIEFFGDKGLKTTMSPDLAGCPRGEIYDDRVAKTHELALPLTSKDAFAIVEKIAGRPFSLTDFNCHHFVLEAWNSMVIQALQQVHYPDRMKLGLLRGWEGSLSGWFSFAASSAGDSTASPTSFQSGAVTHAREADSTCSGTKEATSTGDSGPPSLFIIDARITLLDGSIRPLQMGAVDRRKPLAKSFVEQNSLDDYYVDPLISWLKVTESDASQFPVHVDSSIEEIFHTYSTSDVRHQTFADI